MGSATVLCLNANGGWGQGLVGQGLGFTYEDLSFTTHEPQNEPTTLHETSEARNARC